MRWRGGWLIFLRIYLFIFGVFLTGFKMLHERFPDKTMSWSQVDTMQRWCQAEVEFVASKFRRGFVSLETAKKQGTMPSPVVFWAIRREKRGCFAYIDRIKNAKSVTKSLEICFSTSVFSFATLLFFNIYQRGISPQCSSLTPSVQHNELGISFSF